MVSLAPELRARRIARSRAGWARAVASMSTRMLLNDSIARSLLVRMLSHEMRHSADLLDSDHERDPPAGVVELGCAHDLSQDGVDLVLVDDRQHNLFLRLDRHAEDLFLFVDARPAPEKNGATARSGLHGRLEHRAPPSLSDDAHDQRS